MIKELKALDPATWLMGVVAGIIANNLDELDDTDFFLFEFVEDGPCGATIYYKYFTTAAELKILLLNEQILLPLKSKTIPRKISCYLII